MTWPVVLSLLSLAYWIWAIADTLHSRKWMLRLPRQAAAPFGAGNRWAEDAGKTPLVSVIVAAKEEEDSITDTVKHLLDQNYPRLEIIAVNDRSQDATGRKLDELRRWSEGRKELPVPLRVIHVTRLPDGWLGKNHALYQGYLQARGSLLLFTDADITFSPDAVSAAVRYLQETKADHLTLAPRMVTKGFWLQAFVRYFFFTLSLYVRPWRANDDLQDRTGMGIGAFNLLTRQAYERIGTHRAIARRPDDDLQLGMLVKRHRLRQRLATAPDHLAVEWYPGMKEAIRGLEKNLFSGFGYSVLKAGAGIAGQLLVFIYPWIGLFASQGWPAVAYALCALMMLAAYMLHTRAMLGRPASELAVLPLSALLLTWIVIRSVWLTLRQGGIYWRGTFYPLRELKRLQEP